MALGFGLVAATTIWLTRGPGSDYRTDWDQIWYPTRGLLHGQNPYVVGDSLHRAGWPYPLLYPGTAIVVAAPLAPLPLRLSRAIWIGLGTAGLAWMLTAQGWWGLLAFGSAAYLSALFLVQWSPLLMAGLIPGLGFIWAAKPTIGLVLFAGWPSKSAAIGGALLILLSLVLIPGWPAQMRAGVGAASHIMPIVLRPGGVLLLLALLRWRRPEARMLTALAVVPHTTMIYEMLPLFLIPRNLREMAGLTLLTQIAFTLAFTLRPGDAQGPLPALIAAHWPFWLALVYLPSLWLVLRHDAR